MTVVGRWTGREAKLLRVALRLSIRDFAAGLGVAARTVNTWEERLADITPLPHMQEVLDTALSRASDEVKARFVAVTNVDVAVGSTLLQELLRRRYLHDYREFCRDYNIAAAMVDQSLVGTYPTERQFHRWISGEMVGLPYPDHRNVLEAMFPRYSARQLFEPYQDNSSPMQDGTDTKTGEEALEIKGKRERQETVDEQLPVRESTLQKALPSSRQHVVPDASHSVVDLATLLDDAITESTELIAASEATSLGSAGMEQLQADVKSLASSPLHTSASCTASWLHSVRARSFGHLRDKESLCKALSRAWEVRGESMQDDLCDLLGGASGFGIAKLHYYSANALARVGEADRAIGEGFRALKLYDAVEPAQRSFSAMATVRVDMSIIMLRKRKIDEAVAALGPTLSIDLDYFNAGLRRQLSRARRELATLWNKPLLVRNITAEIDTLLVAQTPTVSRSLATESDEK
ncbi:MAG: hypothetical protein ACRDTC_15035 [Pseudonocardiaceae bacterium]